MADVTTRRQCPEPLVSLIDLVPANEDDAPGGVAPERGLHPLKTRIRPTLVAWSAALVLAASLASATPAFAATEYLGVRDWSTFAAWQAPGSGNIYTAQARVSVARDTATGRIAWRLNTRCLVNGSPATCSRHATVGLAGYVTDPNNWTHPWGTTTRIKENHLGELIWQGAWHNPYGVTQDWFFTQALVQVHWTAPNKSSNSHYVCSHDVYYTGASERSRTAPGGCVPPT
jgi:hypothetical protein